MARKAYIAALDQGTTSTRCIVFDTSGEIKGLDQQPHRQITPRPGWVEHDPEEIAAHAEIVLRGAIAAAGLMPTDIAALGITNQRETTVVWDRRSGKAFGNAIVWQDTRTEALCAALAKEGSPAPGEAQAQSGRDRFRERTGLPLATYFSGPKIRWILDHVPGARAAAVQGDALAGTIDSWLVWRMTGGPEGGAHVTDPTNASRTMLMNLATLQWDDVLLEAMGVARSMLAEIRPSSDPQPYGLTREGIPIHGILGDQQAALFGQACFAPGEAKCTYGTGCFLLLNTGEAPVASNHGLLSTVAYQLGGRKPVYALEGSVAIAGALVQWLRDQLGIIATSQEVEARAGAVADNGGAYIVPAFSGLFAPHWRPDARGVITGLTRYVNRDHLCRAALEATALQVEEVFSAMRRDAALPLEVLKVDGGMVVNNLLMQLQADLLGTAVQRPAVIETTALGAAYAAGLAVGLWPDPAALRTHWRQERCWQPSMDESARAELLAGWRKAVARSLDWVEADV